MTPKQRLSVVVQLAEETGHTFLAGLLRCEALDTPEQIQEAIVFWEHRKALNERWATVGQGTFEPMAADVAALYQWAIEAVSEKEQIQCK